MPIQRDPAAEPADYELLGELASRHLACQTMPPPKKVKLNIDPHRFLQAMAQTDNVISTPPADSELPNEPCSSNSADVAIIADEPDDFVFQDSPAISGNIFCIIWQIAIVLASAGVSAWLIRLWIYG